MTILLLIISALHIHAFNSSLPMLRQKFLEAPGNEAACRHLLKITEGAAEVPVKGYHAAATMIMANHTWNPVAKYNNFRKGKSILEAAIAAHPQHPELRYIRYSLQLHVPFFLNYRSDLAADRVFLQQYMTRSDDRPFRQMIEKVLQLE